MNAENNESKKETNWFARIGIILLILLIISMIIYKFFCKDPLPDISTGVITLIVLAILLILSESFDNFSIGRIITLSRKVKEKENVIEEKNNNIIRVEKEKRELLSQIISISNNFSQKQSNTNIYGISNEALRSLTIQKADESEIDTLEQKEQEEEENKSSPKKKKISHREVVEIALNNYIKENKIDVSRFFKDIKFPAFEGIDSISDSSPIYDAYFSDLDKEIFIEVRMPSSFVLSFFIDKLYIMLSKIHYYRLAKKNNCYLNLIIVENPDSDTSRCLNNILELFRPSLSSGLLKITTMKLKPEELEKIYDK